MGKLADEAVSRLEAERTETLRQLLGLSDTECRTPVEWYGRKQTVGHMLRLFTTHSLDHFQHLHRLLQERGHKFTEAQILLMKANAAQAEFTALVRSLSDEEFCRTGPHDGDWSAAEVVNHVLTAESDYRQAIQGAVHTAATARGDE